MAKFKKIAVIPKRSVGQPPKTLNDEELIKIEAWARTLTYEQIGDALGINQNTFARMIERDPRISESYKKGLSNTIDKVGSVVLKAALSGDLTACFFYLKTKARWKETNHLNISNEDGSMRPLQQILVKYEDSKGNKTPKVVNAIEGDK